MMRIISSILIFTLYFTNLSFANNYYVRDGGGNKSQCTGNIDAVYPGTGTNQPCALYNPMFVLGAGCGNFGFGPCNVGGLMSAGDSLYIHGDSDLNPGTQAQYPIGYDSTGTITPANSSNCSIAGSLNCTMGNPPSGGGSSTMTQILGIGTHQPQMWGREKINQVIEADASFLLLQNIEVTQHSSCIYGSPATGNIGSFPRSCDTSSAPYGPYGIDGVFYGGSGSTMSAMWIHGMSHNGTQSDNLTNWTSIGNTINGNAFNGDAPGDLYSGGTVHYSGNNTWQNDIIVYNGCGEIYPNHSSNPYDTANYHDCWDQANAGQGDGLGTQAATTICSGTLNFNNDDISFNTQDGIDFLHCNSSGNGYLYRMRLEGNEGQQLKMNNTNDYVENSLIMGDCYYHNSSNPIDLVNSNGMNNCRAGGDAINLIFNGGNYNIENSTVLATGPGIQDAGSSAPCSGSLNWFNDNVIGGYNTPVYGNTQLATWIDNECSSGSVAFTEDYNHVWNTNVQAQCAGAHDKCSDTSAAITTTLTISMIGPVSYYTGNDLGHLMYPNPSGQLIGNANNAISLTGTSNDFNNFSRGSSWTIGGYQINSTVSNGGTCFFSSECASSDCLNNVCVNGSCSINGSGCMSGATCCSGLCQSLSCVACLTNGGSCSSNGSCCSGICNAGVCSASSCTSNGGACTIGSTCCSTLCQGSQCVMCESTGGSCSTGANCCSGNCCSGSCALSCGGSSTGIVTQLTGQCATSGKVGF